MEKFSRTMRGYDPEEVNNFLDKVINQVETMVNEINEKDKKIKELQSMEVQNKALQDKLLQYERMEGTLNKAIIMAEKTSEQIKINAHNEAESVLEDADTLQPEKRQYFLVFGHLIGSRPALDQ